MNIPKVIVALDFPNKDRALNFLENFPEPIWVKIGMELFYSVGPSIVSDVKLLGHKVFLDLKLHDIPNTVESAMRSLSELNVDMTNCHASGGIEMMKAARRGFGDDGILIAVTVLTSLSGLELHDEIGANCNINDTVVRWSQNAINAGLDGVVCSAQEAPNVNCITVTPGIRFPENDIGDQTRVVTPSEAKNNGSTYIVVGRPIRNSDRPYEMYKKFVEEFE